MHDRLLIALKDSVTVHANGDDLMIAPRSGSTLLLRQPDAAVRALVDHLATGGMTRDALCERAVTDGGGAEYARVYYFLDAIAARGLLRYTLTANGRRLATLEPMSPAFRFDDSLVLEGAVRLSRFAVLRRDGCDMRLECPLGYAAVAVHDPRAAAAAALLTAPRAASDLAPVMDVDDDTASAFVSLLVNAHAVFPCDADGRIPEDDSVPLRQWEFHDLLFHSRTRSGRHDSPLGGTFRFRDELPSLPAVKPPMSARRVALHRPDMAALDQNDVPCSRVLEARRSIRTRGEQPLTADQLGEFLYRAARIKELCPGAPGQPHAYEASLRPSACGGAMHEIELYLIVSRCDGVEPGLYHYAPLTHELEHLAEPDARQERLLADARGASGIETPPDVLIVLAARFQRTAWKYQSMAYALTLKNAGVLYQQMYIVATAMNLAPCGLGGGNSDLFAEATGLDYYEETSIGEFMLSSAPESPGPPARVNRAISAE